MEYDFIYNRDTKRYSIHLAAEHALLGQFLLDEFGEDASAYQPFIDKLSALKSFQTLRYQGKEYVLDVEDFEVTLSHNSLFYDEDESALQLESLEKDDDLQLDEHNLTLQCGLEDLLILLKAWQQFLTK